jgi:hypothetical protein
VQTREWGRQSCRLSIRDGIAEWHVYSDGRVCVRFWAKKNAPQKMGGNTCGTGLIFNCCDPVRVNSDHGKVMFYLGKIIHKWMVILPLNTFQASNARAVALVT